MRGKIWRKALAASLALLIVTGSVPIKPISNVFESMVVTAEAVEEVTKTYSLSTYVRADDMLSFSLTDPDDNTSKTVFTADGDNYTHTIRRFGSGIQVSNGLSYDDSPNVRFWVLPNVNGKVTKIEFTKACRVAGKVIVGDHDAWPPTWEDTSFFMSIDGMKYNGTDEALTGESHLDERGNTTESENFTFISTDPEGIEGKLSLWLGKMSMFTMLSGCEIKIHYIPAAEPAHEHDFTYSMNGNTLTATCGHSDGKSCSLADSNHQISVSLEAEDAYYQFGYVYPATLLNNSLFASETGATIGNITYRNNTTGVDLGTQKPTGSGENPTGAGDYTASVTINVGGTTYTLTKDYTLSNFYTINNSYPQFSIGTEQYSVTNRAAENETVTLTFTPQYGETLKSLSVKGETTNYSLGHGITKVDDTHYTFLMPAEEVNISEATFGVDENDFVQDGDTYTIKNADGWNYFCLLTNYDTTLDGFNGKTVKLDKDIEVSTMAGMRDHPFKGTFDGQGKTLTFNLTASESNSAPFHYTDDATISNLHVTGLIEGGDISALAGLVGKATGNITIENCHVSTQISTTVSISAWHGGIIAFWDDSNVECTITGCVYDGLIYNPNEANVTSYCFGFIGNSYGSNMNATFTDCLFAPAEYTNDKKALREDYGSHTFVYPKSGLIFHVTNCYYTRNLGNRQGRPAATATTAPANLGNATTDHGLVKGYKNGFLYNGNYYTPKYGDVVVEYPFDDDEERASVTFNGDGDNLVGVNITEDVEKVSRVTYNRTFTEGKAAIVILPFDYICSGSEGGTFYTFAGVNGNQPIMEDGNKLTSLTANTPYLFMPSGTTLSFPNIANMTDGYVTLQTTAGEHNITSDAWTLTGAYEPKSFTTDDSNIMVLNDDGELVAVTDATTVDPTSGYFVRDSSVFAITVNSGEGGTITADPLYAKEKDTVTLTVTPNAGYVLKSLTVKDSNNTPITVTNNQFTMPATNVTVTAEFIKYTLVSANEPTYTSAGNIEYYTGSDGKYYVLENGEYIETTLEAVTLAQLTLTHVTAADPTCTANGNIEYWYDEANNKYFSDANGEHEITQADTVRAATNHDWNAPTYSWTAVDGGYKCTATRTCKNNAGHEETEEATVTYAEITAPTAGAKGSGRYTATFINSAFAVQTKDVEIEMLTPEYADATYKWAADNSSVTAEKKCLNGGADITETVNTTSQITKPATCKAMGETTYYAVFTNGAFAKQEKTVANIEKLAHTPAQAVVENRVEPTYDADGSYDSVVYCSVCGEEISREKVIIPKLERANISSANVTFNLMHLTYTGSAITPVFQVKLGDKVLTENTDFTVQGGNVGTVAGTYTLTLSGTGEYTGTVTAEWYIDPVKTYHVNVTNGTIKGGFDYEEQAVVTVVGNTEVGGWYNGDTLVSAERTYSFYAVSDVDLEWKANDTYAAEKAQEGIANITISPRTVNTNGKTTVTVTSTWTLPEGAEIVKAGTYRCYVDKGADTPDSNYMITNGTFNASTLTECKGTFYFNINMGVVSAARKLCTMTYVTYTLNGETYTITSDVAYSEAE